MAVKRLRIGYGASWCRSATLVLLGGCDWQAEGKLVETAAPAGLWDCRGKSRHRGGGLVVDNLKVRDLSGCGGQDFGNPKFGESLGSGSVKGGRGK